MDPFELMPIAPAVGAEVRGLQVDDLAKPDVLDAIRAAFLQHHVLVFRELPLDREAHKALGRAFGELHIHPSRRAPEFKGDREIFKVHADENTTLNNGGLWHADVTCDEIPPLGSMLRLTTVPEHGGDTLFANMHAAYDALPADLQGRLDGLSALHDQQLDVGRYGIDVPDDFAWTRTVHPMVVRHPETGRKLLFVNRAFTRRVEGLPEAESDELLDMLFDHIAASTELQCRVQWTPDTMVFWDNRCVQHFAMWDYFPQTRSGERVTISGRSRPAAILPA